MKTQTLFYALFQSDNNTHDRFELFQYGKSLEDLFVWIKTHRAVIEKQFKSKVILKDYKINQTEALLPLN